jgi:hypothetical protein
LDLKKEFKVIPPETPFVVKVKVPSAIAADRARQISHRYG